MVQLIVGEKGKGKTKVLLDKVNTEVKEANGTLVYLDKSRKHMYELNNKVRLIDMSDYDIQNSSEFLGFLSGVVSQDNIMERMYLDSFIKISRVTDEAFADVMARLKDMGENTTYLCIKRFQRRKGTSRKRQRDDSGFHLIGFPTLQQV